MSPSEIKIFVSYSHKNLTWIDKKDPSNLIPFLEDCLKQENVTFWYDYDLKTLPGIEYEKKIYEEIDKADIAILLLSQDFVNSDFIRNKELPRIKERLDEHKLEIIPILVEPWTVPDKHPVSWLIKTQIIPGDPTPLIDFTESVGKFKKVRIEILEAVRRTIERVKISKEQEVNHYPNSIEKTEEEEETWTDPTIFHKILKFFKQWYLIIILIIIIVLAIFFVGTPLFRRHNLHPPENTYSDKLVANIDSPDQSIQKKDTNIANHAIRSPNINTIQQQKKPIKEDSVIERKNTPDYDRTSDEKKPGESTSQIDQTKNSGYVNREVVMNKKDFEGIVRIYYHESFYSEAMALKNILIKNKFRCIDDKHANDIIFPRNNFIYYYRLENEAVVKLIKELSGNTNILYEFTMNTRLDNEITIWLQ